EAAYRYQRQIETKDRVLVGLNEYKSEEEQPIPIFRGNPEAERRQIARLQELRQKRDNASVKKSLASLTDAARANENLMPALIETVKSYATLGEICEALRVVYGVYEPSQVF